MARICRVGINAYEANVPRRVGSNQYAFRLLCELERQTREEEEGNEEIAYDWTIYLPSTPLSDLPKPRKGWRYKVIGPSFFWTQWRLPLALRFVSQPFNVFISLGHYAPRLCPFPSIVCVLDLAFLKFPQFFLKKDVWQLREWTAYSVKGASHVFTISENSKKDIQEAYGVSPDKVSIVYPGIDVTPSVPLNTKQQDAIIASYGLQKDRYIVSVGTIQPRKNMITAIHAFERCKEQGMEDDIRLVFVGKPGWMTQEFDDAIADSSQKDKILVTGFVPDDIKMTLLSHARCSVLIGYYEGFGIPALESMLQGVVPVVANAGSLPEVVGEFGILVDPYSVDSIAEGFTQAFAHPPDAMTASRMMHRAKSFSWEASAQTMLDVLERKFCGVA